MIPTSGLGPRLDDNGRGPFFRELVRTESTIHTGFLGGRKIVLPPKEGANVGSPSYRDYFPVPRRALDAIEKGIARAVKTLKNVEGAWVKEQKVIVKNGKISEYRVDLKVTFILVD